MVPRVVAYSFFLKHERPKPQWLLVTMCDDKNALALITGQRPDSNRQRALLAELAEAA